MNEAFVFGYGLLVDVEKVQFQLDFLVASTKLLFARLQIGILFDSTGSRDWISLVRSLIDTKIVPFV